MLFRSPEQRAQFEAGGGGALTPLMTVDKIPSEINTFAQLVEESCQHASDWAIVFVASLPGRHGVAPTAREADQSLQRMIESVKTGSFGAFIPFGRDGEPVLFS